MAIIGPWRMRRGRSNHVAIATPQAMPRVAARCRLLRRRMRPSHSSERVSTWTTLSRSRLSHLSASCWGWVILADWLIS
jgi:hypothetical protein